MITFTGRKLTVLMNGNARMSRGKYAAQAVHAALLAADVEHGTVVVLGAKPQDVQDAPYVIRDAGLTEIAPGTLTAGAYWEDHDLDPGQRVTVKVPHDEVPDNGYDPDGDLEVDRIGSLDLRRVIQGALLDSIHSHGPITTGNVGSAVKRVHGSVRGAIREQVMRSGQVLGGPSPDGAVDQEEGPLPTGQS